MKIIFLSLLFLLLVERVPAVEKEILCSTLSHYFISPPPKSSYLDELEGIMEMAFDSPPTGSMIPTDSSLSDMALAVREMKKYNSTSRVRPPSFISRPLEDIFVQQETLFNRKNFPSQLAPGEQVAIDGQLYDVVSLVKIDQRSETYVVTNARGDKRFLKIFGLLALPEKKLEGLRGAHFVTRHIDLVKGDCQNQGCRKILEAVKEFYLSKTSEHGPKQLEDWLSEEGIRLAKAAMSGHGRRELEQELLINRDLAGIGIPVIAEMAVDQSKNAILYEYIRAVPVSEILGLEGVKIMGVGATLGLHALALSFYHTMAPVVAVKRFFLFNEHVAFDIDRGNFVINNFF